LFACASLNELRAARKAAGAWSYTSSYQYAFMAWCSFKAQGQLYLYLYFVHM